ncbi:hypothetical protein [Nocardia fluminea]|uniref:hypothetical protein n=1 Tax=Nocardia fluminea TaxID=134984 RepID=UPI003657FBB5
MPDTSPSSAKASAGKEALRGALGAVAAFPIAAALVAAAYRFPVPMAGYARGLGIAMIAAATGSIFYLLLGGALILGLLGAAGGFLAARLVGPDPRRVRLLTLALAALVALLGAITLAVLEFFIGPW